MLCAFNRNPLPAMKHNLLSALALFSLMGVPLPAPADNEVGFIERFALAADRDKIARGNLVRGQRRLSEDVA